jgi:nucleoside-diphosphate-sugar epimerase
MNKSKDTVIITGCSGLIGSAVADQLAPNYRIVGFDIKEPDHLPADAIFAEVDLTSDKSVKEGLDRVKQHAGADIRSVIHLAAYYDFSGEPSPLYDEITVRGTGRLIHALQQFKVKQFLFSSTMLVHAPTKPGEPFNEDWVLEPKWDYPRSKVDTEQLLQERRGAIPVVLLRIAGVYDDYCHSIPLAHQMQRIFERHITSHFYPGDLSYGQAFLHMEDLTDALESLVDRAGQLPEVLPLLLGEPETLSYGELQKEFGRLIHGEDWTTRYIPKLVAKTGAWLQDNLPLGGDPFIKPWMIDLADDHFEVDISRARDTLGWSPGHSLRETLPKMVAALKEDPVKWYEEHKLTLPDDLKELQPAGSESKKG